MRTDCGNLSSCCTFRSSHDVPADISIGCQVLLSKMGTFQLNTILLSRRSFLCDIAADLRVLFPFDLHTVQLYIINLPAPRFLICSLIPSAGICYYTS